MKKKIFTGLALFIVAAAIACGIYANQKQDRVAALAQQQVEAMAAGEGDPSITLGFELRTTKTEWKDIHGKIQVTYTKGCFAVSFTVTCYF